MKNQLRKIRRAFTLVEIMIVVLIIGILLAIAVPNFIRSRENSRAKACVNNLRQISNAVEQWAMDNKKNAGDTVALTSLIGVNSYLRNTPTCPSGGTYTASPAVGSSPTCTIGTNGTEAFDDHTIP
jgi:prepilin-type N-terminal cleavage/methylation domain-containing protein